MEKENNNNNAKEIDNTNSKKTEDIAENKTENTNTTAENKQKENKQSNFRRNIILVVFALALLIIYIAFRGNYLEILGIGKNYTDVFWQNIKYQGITMIVNFAFIYLVVYLCNRRIKKGLKVFFEQEKKPMPKLMNKSISFIIAVIVSLITSSFITNKIMMCINATSFSVTDPIFNYDIGYFIMQKPFIEFILFYILAITIVLVIYTAVYYIVVFNKFFDGIDRETLKNSKFISQLLKLVMIIAIIFACIIFVNTQNMGTEKMLELKLGTSNETTEYTIYGSGFTDVNIKLWGYRILCFVLIYAVYKSIKEFEKRNTKGIIKNILIVPGYLVIMFVVLVGYQTIFVGSSELDKEKTYIDDNIENTKNAYGIKIDEINLKDMEVLNDEIADNNKETLDNISIVSDTTVLKDLNSSQTSKGYYAYKNTQLQEYNIDGENTLLYVSPREIETNGEASTYSNKTYEYTHGYGAILTSGVKTSQTGNLEHTQKAFDTENYTININEPRIYFGTNTNSTVVTNSSNKKEFDYPILDSGNVENAENTYNGTAGLTLNWPDRLILGIKEKDLKLAFSTSINKESKIITNRNIINRAKTIMPYLIYDENPYMVMSNEGKQIWVLDAYTVSNDYPYSQRTTIKANGERREINYIRNSVKVLIDAYDGTIKFYITDRTDPIVMAYLKVYPTLFEDINTATIPESISKHFVYPKFLYDIQAEILKTHHNVQTEVLYRGDDIWTDATHNTNKTLSKTGTDLDSYYTMVKTIDSESAKLGLVKLYTQYDKQSLTSYLIGSSNNGNLSLKLYKFASDSNVVGTMQLDTQIEQDEQISKEIQSLYVTGTRIIREMVVVPIDNTLLYVEPIYQQYINEQDALPTLKKVVVATGNKVAIGDNLEIALQNLLSQSAVVNIEVENTEDIDGLIRAIIKANSNLTESNSSNNWEMMGKDVEKLQTLIKELETMVDEQEKKEKEQNENQTTEDEKLNDEELINFFLNKGDKEENISNEIE